MDFLKKMYEMHDKAAYVRSVFSPISDRTACASDRNPDCLNCALVCALYCVHLVKCADLSKPFRCKSHSDEFDFTA